MVNLSQSLPNSYDTNEFAGTGIIVVGTSVPTVGADALLYSFIFHAVAVGLLAIIEYICLAVVFILAPFVLAVVVIVELLAVSAVPSFAVTVPDTA